MITRYYVGIGQYPEDLCELKEREGATFISEVAGGCTVYSAKGYWKDSRGILVQEPCIVFEVANVHPLDVQTIQDTLLSIFDKEQEILIVSTRVYKNK